MEDYSNFCTPKPECHDDGHCSHEQQSDREEEDS